MTLDYGAACKSATTAQGLDPVIERLQCEGVDGVKLEQTGGFCMVVTVTRHTRVYAITRDGDGDAPYLFGTYTKQAWEDSGESALRCEPLSLDAIIHKLTKDRRYMRDYTGRRGPKRKP